jgi:hypothetical protein
MAILVPNLYFMMQQLAFSAKVIAAHPADDLIGKAILVQTGDMQIFQALLLGLAQQVQGGIIKKYHLTGHISRDNAVNR